jgi:hypothetical protein
MRRLPVPLATCCIDVGAHGVELDDDQVRAGIRRAITQHLQRRRHAVAPSEADRRFEAGAVDVEVRIAGRTRRRP